MAKDIKNANTIAYKLGSASRRAINQKLEVAREEKCEGEKIVKRQKTKAIATKCCKDRGRISLLNKKKGNYKSDTKDNIDLNQSKEEYP